MVRQKHKKERTVSLMELIRGLMEYAIGQGIKSFPPFRDSRWHDLLFSLKASPGSFNLFPKIIGEFDWDGPCPKNRKLDQVMFGLGYISLECWRHGDFRIVLNPNLSRLARSPSFSGHPRFNEAILIAFERADKIQGFFER